jgi:hypothetical protein
MVNEALSDGRNGCVGEYIEKFLCCSPFTAGHCIGRTRASEVIGVRVPRFPQIDREGHASFIRERHTRIVAECVGGS